jgi:curved DNA-binding protein CbpA
MKGMKDYYEVLGVRKTASEEDIRVRWIELIREFHPDGRKRGRSGESKSKEINEAYQVLKHPSTRVEYDLKMAYYRKKRGRYRGRLIVFSILTVFFILGLIYLRRPEIDLMSSPTMSSAIHPMDDDKENFSPVLVPPEQNSSVLLSASGEPEELKKPIPPSDSRAAGNLSDPSASNDIKTLREIEEIGELSEPKKLRKANETSATKARQELEVPMNLNQLNDTEASPHIAKGIEPATARESGSPVGRVGKPDNPNDLSFFKSVESDRESQEPNRASVDVGHFLISSSSSTQMMDETSQPRRPSLMATEEEIRQFLANYIERYNGKDIDGFLSLFSARAVQNDKDGIDDIRKTYSDFFNQSQELQYRLENTTIEIYQNAVGVRARYRVDQTVGRGREQKVWRGGIRWTLVRENGMLRIRHLDYRNEASP